MATKALENTPSVADVEKLTFRLGGDAMAEVRRQAAKKGISINEFVRQAIGTEVYLQEKIAQGARILVEDRNHTTREIVLR